MEVRHDACLPLYEGQPNCSRVMQLVRSWGHGHAPPAPINCHAPLASVGAADCEMEILFLKRSAQLPPLYWPYHNPVWGGCVGLYDVTERRLAQRHPPRGMAVLSGKPNTVPSTFRFYLRANESAVHRFGIKWLRPWAPKLGWVKERGRFKADAPAPGILCVANIPPTMPYLCAASQFRATSATHSSGRTARGGHGAPLPPRFSFAD